MTSMKKAKLKIDQRDMRSMMMMRIPKKMSQIIMIYSLKKKPKNWIRI